MAKKVTNAAIIQELDDTGLAVWNHIRDTIYSQINTSGHIVKAAESVLSFFKDAYNIDFLEDFATEAIDRRYFHRWGSLYMMNFTVRGVRFNVGFSKNRDNFMHLKYDKLLYADLMVKRVRNPWVGFNLNSAHGTAPAINAIQILYNHFKKSTREFNILEKMNKALNP